MSSCEGGMILLFNSTILQGDCRLVEEFFNIEQRINNDKRQRPATVGKRERETDAFN